MKGQQLPLGTVKYHTNLTCSRVTYKAQVETETAAAAAGLVTPYPAARWYLKLTRTRQLGGELLSRAAEPVCQLRLFCLALI